MTKQWTVTLYHDEPEEAAVESWTIEGSDGPVIFKSRTGAIAAAQGQINDYWQTAQVETGIWHEPIFGVAPGYWERAEDQRSWLVGRDWAERG